LEYELGHCDLSPTIGGLYGKGTSIALESFCE
jgi:hypothetical protein